MTRRATAILLLGVAWLALAPAAQAEEPSGSPSLLLKLLNVPVDSPEVALRESLKIGPGTRPEPEWVILPDGSARYGTETFSVTVRPGCQYGAPAALPGRRLR